MLVVWLAFVCLSWMAVLWRGGKLGHVVAQLPFALLVAVLLVWVVPALEETNSEGQPIGLAIRGYGVMLLLAMIASVGAAAYRARQVGLDSELILSLAVWLVLGGIAGARALYVIEYWRDFQRDTLWETIVAIVKFTEGGLVVYGAIIGGLAAGAFFVTRHRLPTLAMADLIAPSLAIGLSIGRIGCFLTGCCFGGICPPSYFAVTFPFGSPAYVHQLEHGTLWGMHLVKESDDTWRIAAVASKTAAEQHGLQVGQRLRSYQMRPWAEVWRAQLENRLDSEVARAQTNDGKLVVWTVRDLPHTSRPVYPTQLFASLNAALLAWLVWTHYPLRKRDGEVFALLFTLYPISRFLLEIIRDDEPGQWGTALTISQWFALLTLLVVAALWYVILRRPAKPVFLYPNVAEVTNR